MFWFGQKWPLRALQLFKRLNPHGGIISLNNEPRSEKTGLRGLRTSPTQTGLYGHRKWLEAWNFVFGKKKYCTIQVAEKKALISFAVTAKLICVFVFAYAKIRFSHVAAFIILTQLLLWATGMAFSRPAVWFEDWSQSFTLIRPTDMTYLGQVYESLVP